MNTKTLLSFVFGGLLVVVVSYVVLSHYAQNVEIQKEQAYTESRKGVTEGAFAPEFLSQEKTKTEEVALSLPDTQQEVIEPKSPSVPTPTPAPTPTPVPAPTPKAEGYTEAEVATHNNETSCWSIIHGKVYDLTSFVGKHPGGERNILKICGKDGTTAFSGQHGGQGGPEAMLQKHYLGVLTQ
jgi:cytochrome b involved in lipid metabolism